VREPLEVIIFCKGTQSHWKGGHVYKGTQIELIEECPSSVMGLRATGKVVVSVRGLRATGRVTIFCKGAQREPLQELPLPVRGLKEGPNARKGMVPRLDPEKGRLLAE
jgi:hypothetical protein